MRRQILGFATTLLVVASPTFAATHIVSSGGSIQAAINGAVAGDTVFVEDGTYPGSLDIIDKALTLEGESEAGVIIDASGSADYSIDSRSTDLSVYTMTFKNFTLIGNATGAGTYGLKIAGENVVVDVSGVTVQDSRRTAIDLNGCAGGTITDVVATGVSFGNGIALTDCDDVALADLTTSGNAWGGLAIYSYGAFYGGGSNNVSLSGTNSIGDSPEVYSEVTSGFGDPPITNLSIPISDYPTLVGSAAAPSFNWYYPSEAAAVAALVLSGGAEFGWIVERSSGDYVVDPNGGMKYGPALAVASPGATVVVRSGPPIVEQLHITQDVTIEGAGVGSTTIESPAVLATIFTTSGPNKPVVAIDGAENVILRDLTVDGLGNGNANVRMHGIAFWNGGGKVLNCNVVGIRDTPLSGVQHGLGIYTFNDDSGPHAVEIGGCDISDFQKNAMALSGDGMVVDVHDCVTTGAGDIAVTAQNGIQVSFGAGGTVRDCTISGVRYTPATFVASGLLTFLATSVDASNVVVTASQAPVSWYDTSGSMTDCDITGGDFDGAFFYNSTASAQGLDRAFPSAYLEEYVPSGQSRSATAMSVSLIGGCYAGSLAPGTSAIYVLSLGGPLTVSATNMRVVDYDYGFIADGAAVTLNVNDSFIAGNLTAGYDNSLSGGAQDVTQNWWGMADGPSGDGPGTGDAVSGGGATFSPWRIDDSSTTACPFTPAITNDVTPTADPMDCIAGDPASCLTVDIDVTRSDNTEMRGFSIDIQLTNLALCSTPGASILESTYLSAIGGTAYQVLDNGGGSYTIDCAILGNPCGQDAASGTLFTVDVTKDATDGIGTLAVTSVIFRDCLNAPIPGTPGTDLDITVDTVDPIAVADLSAAQKLAGNDGDGTTAVAVAFSAPGDAAVVEVYRAPYLDTGGSNAYPEYDDVAGGAPAAPASYPPGAPWVLTGVTTTGDEDETVDRGFWYYVMYSKDLCGNVSDVSNLTDGVLNYHLGDVSDGATPGAGDNLVSALDISLLGANYGAVLVPSDPVNYLDVGPTDDFSVSGFPTTDNLVNFEDLILFAINFGVVSATEPLEHVLFDPKRHSAPALRLEVDGMSLDGTLIARLFVEQPLAVVQGVHAGLTYDARRLELIDVVAGELIEQQDRPVFFDTIATVGRLDVDATVLGTGQAMRGSGEFATLRFRVVGTEVGPRPHLELSEASLRDVWNRDILNLDWTSGEEAANGDLGDRLDSPGLETVDSTLGSNGTELLGARPNPFRSNTAIRFQLEKSSEVVLEVFDVSGRLVQSMNPGWVTAGLHAIQWDGTSSSGENVRSGLYLYRLHVGERVLTSKLYVQR